VERQWLDQWPLTFPQPDDLGDEEALKKHNDELALLRKRIPEWFRNHTRDLKKQSNALASLMKPQPQKRALQAVEIYSKQFYSAKIQAQVKSTIATNGVSSRGALNVVRAETQKAFASETPEVRAAVFALRDEGRKELKKQKEQAPDEPTPLEYA
ncbi:hypothetical protein H0H92_000659, partial [Tricholoma furcatifolium]